MSEEEVKDEAPVLSQEDVDLIFKGIRPDNMEYEAFRYYRRIASAYYKQKLKGNFIHVSSWMEPIEGTKEFIRKTSTYIKPKEKG